jgi:hypothetical protein
MDQDVASIAEAARSHAWLILAWLLLTAIVNTIFHFATPADVDAWAEKNPTVAKIAALFRRLGIEPVAALTTIASFFSGRPPPPGPLGRRDVIAERKPATPPRRDDTELRNAVRPPPFLPFACWICVLIPWLTACSPSMPTPAQHADVVVFGDEMDACVKNATTLEESHACRAKVRAKHGRPPR